MIGLIRADFDRSNARGDGSSPMAVNAPVDRGASHACSPRQVAAPSNQPVRDRRQVAVADDRARTLDGLGTVRLRFAGRQCLVGAPVPGKVRAPVPGKVGAPVPGKVGAPVPGEQALPGALAVEDMNLVASPSRDMMTVAPAGQGIAASTALGLRTAHP